MLKAATAGNVSKFGIYNAKGDLMYSYQSPKVQQFLWRPRPTRNWTDKIEKEFKKEFRNIKKSLKVSIFLLD